MASKVWNGPGDSVWDTDANWTPTGSPLSQDDATIYGPTGATYSLITGRGVSASLVLVSDVALSGTLLTGAFSAGTRNLTGNGVSGAGTTVFAKSVQVYGGPLSVSGAGSRPIDSGALSLSTVRNAAGYINPVLTVSGGGGDPARRHGDGLGTRGERTIRADCHHNVEIIRHRPIKNDWYL